MAPRADTPKSGGLACTRCGRELPEPFALHTGDGRGFHDTRDCPGCQAPLDFDAAEGVWTLDREEEARRAEIEQIIARGGQVGVAFWWHDAVVVDAIDLVHASPDEETYAVTVSHGQRTAQIAVGVTATAANVLRARGESVRAFVDARIRGRLADFTPRGGALDLIAAEQSVVYGSEWVC